jgi:D-glycero-D-manno-heptose 1,7-bisphosphate phosphatase
MTPSAAVFLDRDGVLNEPVVRDGRPHPPRSVDEMVVCDGAEAACAELRRHGFRLICVTNQPDIARGTAREDDVAAISAALKERLGLAEVVTCPHDNSDDCNCRKPKPGMILDTAERLGIAVEDSFMVGDRWRDIEAGTAAGCRTIFIDRGYIEERPVRYDHKSSSLAEAVPWIIRAATINLHKRDS